MNPVAEEILMHYGMPRRSGRYPYGSGDNPYQHGGDFLSRIEELKSQGWTETPENIKKYFGMTTTQYRTEKSIAKDQRRSLLVARARSLKEDGLGDSEIGRQMGVNESTVRSWLNPKSEQRMKQAQKTADFLRDQIKEKGMIDVGAGVERELNVSKEKLNEAISILQAEGYPVYGGRINQVTNNTQKTTLKVLCPPGTEHHVIFDHPEQIHSVRDYISHDGGETFSTFQYPKSMDSSRLKIRYAEEGGLEKDGVVEIRRGVKDLSLGNDHYSQVRILVDGNKYIKGMAVYSDDIPDGVDMVFNTNKKSSVPKSEVLKSIKDDPDNPFGALIKAGGQSYYIDDDGKQQLSLINKTRGEGDWEDWKDKVPSQFLSKQPLSLAKKQLDLAAIDKLNEYKEICELTNPTVKKNQLLSFADDCDAAAVNLQAAALPGQKYHVILPVSSMKDTEVYAPRYEDGTKLALVRYPHGGTFEIPIVTVNNKHAAAEKLIGKQGLDAIGINSRVAERLSGADFDGDTVMCIPATDKSGKLMIKSTNRLKGLEGFDPKTEYGGTTTKDADGTEHYFRNGKEYRRMKNTGTQMGIVSNLITDMTLRGATEDELARAVRHSMVVIDAEKHKLDYKQSEIDNGIAALRRKYQGTVDENGRYHQGAATLISRAKGEVSVDKRQGTPRINMAGKPWYDPTRPEGALVYKTADDVEYTVTKKNKKTGEETTVTKRRQQQSTRMGETDDAYTLVSDANTSMERLYADYANKMKSLANEARKEMMMTGKIEYSSAAKATYKAEVEALMRKLETSELNAPRERQAQRLANAEINAKKKANPDMKKADIKKASQQALTKYRNKVGAKRHPINITNKEWEAIQAGAISENVLTKILKNADSDNLRQLATPRATTKLSATKINKIKAMSSSNKYSLAEIAKACGVSTATVSNYLKGAN